VSASDFLSFEWLEGSRTFAIAFGTVTSLACLSIGGPLLYWCLPASRRWFFSRSRDPHLYLQIATGVICMSMTCANALCRYIPHRPLGFVHPAFFLTTLLIVGLFGPRMIWFARQPSSDAPRPYIPSGILVSALAVMAAFPIVTVVQAFWF
jgi:hypothetical protein